MSFSSELEYNGGIEKVVGVQFSIMSPQEIRQRAVVDITKAETFSGLVAVNNGLFDINMGVLDNGKLCPTDLLDNRFCPGYFGKIELAVPVFYIHFINYIVKTLEKICYKCGTLLLRDADRKSLVRLLAKKKGYKRYLELNSIMKRPSSKTENRICSKCQCEQPEKFKKEELARITAYWKPDTKTTPPTVRSMVLTPEYVLILFQRLSDEDCELMGFHPKHSRPEWMICQVLPVCPPAVRPSVKMDNSQRMEDDLTHKLIDVIKANNLVRDRALKLLDEDEQGGGAATSLGSRIQGEDHRTTLLQYHVATLIDNEIPNVNPAQQRTGRPLKSIRQRLKGKEGRIRGNLMGKRVDFSARTVITPDPLIRIDQLGVPIEICKNLTYPERVTIYNIERLRETVENGPDKFPGAKSIRKGLKFISLRHVDCARKAAELSLGDVVNRHLNEGDVVLFNRQPSLHKMSMMAHRVKPTPSRTFRLAVDVTVPYNADFDGDEMNMHVPQSVEARNELECLAAVYNQVISPALNKPIIYLVQDSCLGLYLLTRDTCDAFPLKDLMNSLMFCNRYRIPPSEKRISGHEALNCILPNINICTANTSFDEKQDDRERNIVTIKNGRFVGTGIIDKSVMNKSSKGLVHVSFNDAGVLPTRDMIDNIRFLITNFMLNKGFSVGVSDLVIDETVYDNIRANIRTKKKEVHQHIADVHNNRFVNRSNKSNNDELESILTKTLDTVVNDSGSSVQENLRTRHNRFIDMVRAGSKGSTINISQMIACVGQVSVDGKRIPFGFQDRTLPHFSKFDDSAEARGFVENSFIKGLTPQEFFFHAMGGREGLIDTAVKTSETGYIQRKLVKTLEDLKVHYDGTVRDANNSIVQFSYGEDGCDPCKIEEIPISFVALDDGALEREFSFSEEEKFEDFVVGIDALEASRGFCSAALVREMRCFRVLYIEEMCKGIPKLIKPPTVYFPINFDRCILNIRNCFHIDTTRSKSDLHPRQVLLRLEKFLTGLRTCYGDHTDDTLLRMLVMANLSPKHVMKKHRLTEEALEALLEKIESMFHASRVEPGEMVGAIAAQSIGEPATQMTLNTFHFAGVGEKSNVTRGVPRIKELFNITKSPKKPSMTIYPRRMGDAVDDKSLAKNLLDLLEITTLGNVVASTGIYYRFPPSSFHARCLGYIERMRHIVRGGSAPENPLPPTWIIVFRLDRKRLMEKNIGLEEVSEAVKMGCPNDFTVFLTDESLDIPCIYILFTGKVVCAAANEEGNERLNVMRLLEKHLLEKVVLRGIPDLIKISLFQTQNDGFYEADGKFITPDCWVLDSIGSNLLDTLAHPLVDSRNSVSNSIYHIHEVLGIEAARNALFIEIDGVIRQENSYVNVRHIGLLADAMTTRGILMSVDRHGTNRADIGPLAKCSFEETDQMLYKAAVFGELDNIKGVSSNIMLGQVPPSGTGFVDVMFDEDEHEELFEDPEWERFMDRHRSLINRYHSLGSGAQPLIEAATDELSFDFNPEL